MLKQLISFALYKVFLKYQVQMGFNPTPPPSVRPWWCKSETIVQLFRLPFNFCV